MSFTVSFLLNIVIIIAACILLCRAASFAAPSDRFVYLCAILIMCYILLSDTLGIYMRASHDDHITDALVPLGAGWSFFLNRKGNGGRYINTNTPAFQGLQHGDDWWGAGTKIKDLQKHLRRRHLTLLSHPSVQNGTLGGWIASGSHGSGGTLWKPQFSRIKVKDLTDGRVFVTKPKTLFNDTTRREDDRRYLILQVQVVAVPDVWCTNVAFKLMSEADAARYLETDTFLRMMQIGKRGTMVLLWEPEQKGDEDRRAPYTVSQTGLYLQSDLLSIVQSNAARTSDWFDWPVEPEQNFRTKLKLSAANKFTMEPNILTTPIGLAFTNFEMFLQYHSFSSRILWDLTTFLEDMFQDLYGRCELRGDANKLYLDFVVLRGANIEWIVDHVKSFWKAEAGLKIYFHKGKFQVSDVIPLQ